MCNLLKFSNIDIFFENVTFVPGLQPVTKWVTLWRSARLHRAEVSTHEAHGSQQGSQKPKISVLGLKTSFDNP